MTASGVHNLDAMIHLFGKIDEVYAMSLRRAVGYDAEDTTSVMFGFAGGMSATLLCSIVTAVSYRLAVFGTKGCAELLTPQADFHFTATPDRCRPAATPSRRPKSSSTAGSTPFSPS